MTTQWWIYLIRCADDSLYTGIATDVERRFNQHKEANGKGAKYLRGKGPLKLELKMPVASRGLALKTELKIKKLSKTKKEELINKPELLKKIIQKLEKVNEPISEIQEETEAGKNCSRP